MTSGRFCSFRTFLADLLDYEQARNMLLSCPLVLVIALAVNVQSGPAVGVAHEFLHHLYPFALLDQERRKRMPEGTRADYPLAIQFFIAISASHFAAFFFAVQVLGGPLLLSRFFVPLALTLLAAELYNILAFHLALESGSGIGPGLVACVPWVLVFLQYRDSFSGIFSARPAAQP